MEEAPVYLFSHRCNPEAALEKILEHLNEEDIAYGENGNWAAEGLWGNNAEEGVFRLKIDHDPRSYTGAEWTEKLQEMIDFFQDCPGAERRPDLFKYLPELRFGLILTFSPGITGADDPRLNILMELAESLAAVIYDTGTLRDPHGAMLLANDRQPDLAAQVPDVSDPGPAAEFQYAPPTAQEVIGRLRVVLLLAQRGWLELDPAMEDPQGDFDFLLKLSQRESITAAALPGELETFRQPLGQLSQRDAWHFLWLCEGAAVLAWALQLVDLPPYDERVPIPFLLENAPYYPETPDWALCDKAEITNLTIQTSFLLLRLQTFAENGEPMDFFATAKAMGIDNARNTLTLARINQYDLEIGEVPISLAPEDARLESQGILVQRQEALAWLLGLKPSYSWASIEQREDV